MKQPISVVTGGGGLIGSHLVDILLEKGHEVRVLEPSKKNASVNLSKHFESPNFMLRYVDIRIVNQDNYFFQEADYVFHLAGMMDLVPSMEHPADYMDVNVNGTVKVLEASRKAGIKKLVYAASSSCYGDTPQCPIPETDPIVCKHPYALSKFMGEQATFHWHQVYGLPANSIRIFNAYSPRFRGSGGTYGAVFGVFLKQKLSGAPFTVVGDGTQGRDFVHARDVAMAFYLASQTDHVGEAYNIGAGKLESVNRIIELLGGGETVHLPKRPGEPDVIYADISKAIAHLGWEPKISFAEGVAEMEKDIQSFAHIPLWDKDSIADATKTWFKELSK